MIHISKTKKEEKVFTSSNPPMEVVKITEPSKYSWGAILLMVLFGLLVIWLLWKWLFPPQTEATSLCEQGKYCADWNWNHTYCEDWDYKLCHTNPSHSETLNFNNLTSCNNHLGTPHSTGVSDTAGVCVAPTPTPTGTPNPTPTPTPEPECEKDCEPTPTPTPEVTPPPENTPTPTPTQTPTLTSESKPEGCTHDCPLPACTDTTPPPVTNPHIYRSGSCAIVKYWPSSDKVNLYWKENSNPGWQHALANQPATGNHEICGLSGDVTFGVQSVSGCAADGIVNASNISVIVDGNTSHWILFR